MISTLAAAGGYTVNGALDAAAAMQKILPLKPGSSSTTGTLGPELDFEDAYCLTCWPANPLMVSAAVLHSLL